MAAHLRAVRHPADIAYLPFVANLALRKPLHWPFTQHGPPPVEVDLQARIAIHTTLGVLAAVRGGGCLSVLPKFLVAAGVASGELVHVLPDWALPSGGIHTVFPAARFRSSKVATFVRMLTAADQT